MSPDQFADALRAIDANLFLDDAGTATLLGTEYAATSREGAEVRVTRLAPELTEGLRDRDAFVRVVERHGYVGAGIAGGALYVVEAPPRGEPLAARLAREGTIRPTLLAPIAVAAGRELHAGVHRHAPHGWISPATLMVEGEHASFRWPGVVPGLVAAGADLASVARRLDAADYLAPELTDGAGGPAFDARSDVYELGATLYAGATGRPPFGGRTTASTMAAVLSDDATVLASPGRRLTAAVLRAIERDPSDRWDDANRFTEAVMGAPLPRSRGSQEVRRRGRGRTIATLVVIALTLLAFLLWRLTH